MKRLFFLLFTVFFSLHLTAQITISWPEIPDQCENSPLVMLPAATPAGGSFSGPQVSGNTFDPAAAGIGVHFLTYTYSDTATGINYDSTQTVIVYPSPSVNMASFGTICADQAVVTLNQGTPVGGTYKGDGVYFNNFFIVDSAGGAGAYPINYVFLDTTTGCADSVARNLIVNPNPPVNLLPFSGICDDQAPFGLVGGTPSGGNYIINFQDTVSIFDPQVFGADSHIVSYTFTDAVGCSASDTSLLVINAVPTTPFILPWSTDTLLCSTQGETYEWLRNDTGIVQNVRFLPVPNQNGIYKVRVTTDGCTSNFSNDYNYGEWVSVEDVQAQEGLTLFPNPTTGSLNIKLENSTIALVTLFDQVGKEVSYHQVIGTTQIDVSSLPKGIYFVQIAQGNSFSTHRLVIE